MRTTVVALAIATTLTGTFLSAAPALAAGSTTTTVVSTTTTSVPSAPVAPSAPTLTKVVSLHSGFILFFTTPKHRGSSAITTYQYSLNAGTTWVHRPSGTTGTSLSMMGLPQHTPYAICVRAISAAGPSPASNVVRASTTR